MSYTYNGTESGSIHKRGDWGSSCKNKCYFNYESDKKVKNWITELDHLYNGHYWCEANWRLNSSSPTFGNIPMGSCNKCGYCVVCKPSGCNHSHSVSKKEQTEDLEHMNSSDQLLLAQNVSKKEYFMETTQCNDPNTAHKYLSEANWDADVAAINYVHHKGTSEMSDIYRMSTHEQMQMFEIMADADKYRAHITMEQANSLNINDNIDHRDNFGLYRQAQIVGKCGNDLKLQYNDYTTSWGNYVSQLNRFAEFGSITSREIHRLNNLKIGDYIDVNPLNADASHGGWKLGELVGFDKNSKQVKVKYVYMKKDCEYWVHLDNEDEAAHAMTRTFDGNEAEIKSNENVNIETALNIERRKCIAMQQIIKELRNTTLSLNNEIQSLKKKKNDYDSSLINALSFGTDTMYRWYQCVPVKIKDNKVGYLDGRIECDKETKAIPFIADDVNDVCKYVVKLRENTESMLSKIEIPDDENEDESWANAAFIRQISVYNCLICMESAPNMFNYPCGHVCYCSGCAAQVIKQSTTCPNCRQNILECLDIRPGGFYNTHIPHKIQ